MLVTKSKLAAVTLAALMAAFSALAAEPAAAQDCAGCRAAHNACRIQSKGSPSCDGQLTSCLSGCRRGGGGGGPGGGGIVNGGGRGGPPGDHGGPRPRTGGGDRGHR